MVNRHSLFFINRQQGLLKSSATLVSLFLLFSLYAAVPVSASINYSAIDTDIQFSTHSYSTANSNAYDGSNSSYAFINVRGCDSQSCTANSFAEVEYELTPLSNPTKIEFEWNIQPVDSFTPSGSTTTLSFYNHVALNWVSTTVESGTIPGWELVEVTLSSQYIGSSGEVILRIKGEHTDTGESSDELGIWLREFHFYSEVLDGDGDGIGDEIDDCPSGMTDWISNAQTDYDSDGCQDSGEDTDDDNDDVPDTSDNCAKGELAWASNAQTDYDSDGCQDLSEDTDDDNDDVLDASDNCTKGELVWASNTQTDYDSDGCQDSSEDADDDDDGVLDASDNCTKGELAWESNAQTDYDLDGCRDSGEDTDDDNDGYEDSIDIFSFNSLEWADNDGDGVGDNADSDDDNDGYSDVDEMESGTDSTDGSVIPVDFDSDFLSDFMDLDDDNDGLNDGQDNCPRNLFANWGVKGNTNQYTHDNSQDLDSDGCRDMDEDDDDDNDQRDDGDDVVCTRGGEMNWNSLDVSLDHDEDGCRDDSDEDTDDDNDGFEDQEEENCNTNPIDATNFPSDSDGDGLCDFMDPVDDSELLNNTSNSSEENTTSNGDSNTSGDAGEIPGQGSDEASSDDANEKKPAHCISKYTCSPLLERFSEDPGIKAFLALITIGSLITLFFKLRKHSAEIQGIEDELDQGDEFFEELGIDVKR